MSKNMINMGYEHECLKCIKSIYHTGACEGNPYYFPCIHFKETSVKLTEAYYENKMLKVRE